MAFRFSLPNSKSALGKLGFKIPENCSQQTADDILVLYKEMIRESRADEQSISNLQLLLDRGIPQFPVSESLSSSASRTRR